jgi:hypothetical protein
VERVENEKRVVQQRVVLASKQQGFVQTHLRPKDAAKLEEEH